MFTTNSTATPTAIFTRRALARKRLLVALATGSVLFASDGGVAVAQEKPQKGSGELVIPDSKPGEADFDKAIQMRINVDSLDKLNEIVILVDSAIRKGLSPASDEAAKTFLASVLKQRVEFGIRDLQESRRSQARSTRVWGSTRRFERRHQGHGACAQVEAKEFGSSRKAVEALCNPGSDARRDR